MYAVIQGADATYWAGMISIAGRPLVVRQIQWLRTAGCKGIAVQIGACGESMALGEWLATKEPLGACVRMVPTRGALSPREIARRAGFPEDEPLLAIRADVLCGGDVQAILAQASPEQNLVHLAPHEALSTSEGAAVEVLGAKGEEGARATGAAWALSIHSLADAFAVSVAVLDGRLSRRPDNGVLLHASEREPGVWVSRGVHIHPTAKLIPPVLLGVDTVVCAGARVGPRVFLGDRSVIERGASLEDAIVATGTIVGENLTFKAAGIDPMGAQDLFTGEHATIDETLALAPRDEWHNKGGLPGRTVAFLVLLAVAPVWAVVKLCFAVVERRGTERRTSAVFRLVKALLEAVWGERALIGVSAWEEEPPPGISDELYSKAMAAPLGVFAVDRALVPPGADAAANLRVRVYYAHEKRFGLDVSLVLRCMRLMFRAAEAATPGATTYVRALP